MQFDRDKLAQKQTHFLNEKWGIKNEEWGKSASEDAEFATPAKSNKKQRKATLLASGVCGVAAGMVGLYSGAVNRLTPQEQRVLVAVLSLLLVGLAVKVWRTGRPIAQVQPAETAQK